MLPLVCSRFRRLLQQPGSWQEVAFAERRMLALAEELRLRLFLAWAHRISRGLRRLKIDVPADLDDPNNGARRQQLRQCPHCPSAAARTAHLPLLALPICRLLTLAEA